MVIDVHAHLTSTEFSEDLDMVIGRAGDAGLSPILIAGEDYQDNLEVLEIQSLPLESLLMESGAPVLGPLREARNEPSFIVQGAQKIAELKDISREEVIAISENARKLFLLAK
jgi:Tat protein secretion system quality control protein TatD with DNase activity